MDKGSCVFPPQNFFVHNKVPSNKLYYWGSGSLMEYPLEKLFGCCFFTLANYLPLKEVENVYIYIYIKLVQLATEVRLAGMRFASRTSKLKSIPALFCRSAPWWDCRLWSGPADICREVIVRSRADEVTFRWHWMSRAILLSERLLVGQPDTGPGARPQW